MKDSVTANTENSDKIEIKDPQSGKLLKVMTLKNGVPHGEMLIYDDSETVSHKLYFEEGVLNGPAEFYVDGKPMMITEFRNGQQAGETTVYTNGKKSTVMHYKDGMIDGPFMSFDEQGNLIREVVYVAGKMEGECSVYYPDGTLMEHSTYKNGQLDGEVQKYYPSGVVREISTFENGEPIGYIDVYDMNGDLQESKEI